MVWKKKIIIRISFSHNWMIKDNKNKLNIIDYSFNPVGVNWLFWILKIYIK